ncbi:unnamed protein product [Thelazia callipaeda]|uniref:USP domain-containing protein n=1 Tax=Thelazia callipaeda TaxID=103827 RepID=A0A0N5CQQ3_THECL|nr:unnamed protein product [Thelazia callipaeda]
MDDQLNRKMQEDDSKRLRWDSDNSKKRRYASKRAFYASDSHCSAPSSSPHSSPVDPSMLVNFNSNEFTDAIRSYSRSKNDMRPSKSEDDNGEWWIQLDEMPTQDDNSLLQVKASASPDLVTESISSKSETEDVVESVESPQSKFELDEDDEQTPFASTPSKRHNVDFFNEDIELSDVSNVPVLLGFEDIPAAKALSNSAPASTVGSSSSIIDSPLQRPSMFDVKALQTTYGELNAIANERPKKWEKCEDFPPGVLFRFYDQINRARWVIPVLPDQELETLLEISIVLIRRGADKKSTLFESFLDNGLVLVFDKLMNDEAMKDWKIDIHRCIWLNIARFLVMFTEKLRQTLIAEDIHSAYWMILYNVFSSSSRYCLKLPSFLFSSVNFHMQNFGRKAQFLQMQFDPSDLILYTSINSVDEVNQAFFCKRRDFQKVLQLWLLLLLNYFGRIGGFSLMKSFLEKNVNHDTKITDLIMWCRPFSSCLSLLKPTVVFETFGFVIQKVLTQLEQINDEELKCETVKNDFNESPYIDLIRIFLTLTRTNPEMASLRRQTQFFSLRYILRVLQVAPFAGRIAALEELHVSLLNIFSEFRQQEILTSMKELKEWLGNQHFIEILVRDNLHHPAYCERLERVFRALIERDAITVNDMDILWNAQREKHDVIQRNVHELIAKLAKVISSTLQEHLFHQMKESWGCSSSRERTLLLDLLRRLGLDFNTQTEKELTVKSLMLLWDLFHDELLPVEMVDAALEAHFSVLEHTPMEELRRHYIGRCIDELLLDSVFVVPAIKHMQRLMVLMPECNFSSTKKSTRQAYQFR